jgi:hypothetical protein
VSECAGKNGVELPLPIGRGTAVEDGARGAFVTQIELDHDQRCLRLRLLLRQPLAEGQDVDDPTDVWLRFPRITNVPHVEAFFFGRKPKL